MVIEAICFAVTIISLLCLLFTKLKLKALLLYLVKNDFNLMEQEFEECIEETLRHWLGIGKK